MLAHVVKEGFLDYVGKGSLYIKEDDGSCQANVTSLYALLLVTNGLIVSTVATATVRGTAWYSLDIRGLVLGEVGGGVGRMVYCNRYSDDQYNCS